MLLLNRFVVAFNRDDDVSADISIAPVPVISEAPSYRTSIRTVLSHMSTSVGARTYSRAFSWRTDIVSPPVETDFHVNNQTVGESRRQSLGLHVIRHRPTTHSVMTVESTPAKSIGSAIVEVRRSTSTALSQGRPLIFKTPPRSEIASDKVVPLIAPSPPPGIELSAHGEKQTMPAPSTVASAQTENQSEENDWRSTSSLKTPHSNTEPSDVIQVDYISNSASAIQLNHTSNPASSIRDRHLSQRTVESWSTFGKHPTASRPPVPISLPARSPLRPGQRPSAFGLSMTGPRPPPMAVVSPNRPSMKFEEERTSSPREI
jgi:hypothetical protein